MVPMPTCRRPSAKRKRWACSNACLIPTLRRPLRRNALKTLPVLGCGCVDDFWMPCVCGEMLVKKIQRTYGSHLFTVRLWNEVVSENCTEWRGKVQHVLSGEMHYFRDWPTLIAFLMHTMDEQERSQPLDRSDERL